MAASRDVVRLNVGGSLFTMARSTLARWPDCMLGAMFRSELPPGALEAGGVFIDRDPAHFQCILTFLRDGRVPLPEAPLARAQLRQEARFYALTELVDAIDDAEQPRRDAEAVDAQRRAARAALEIQRERCWRRAQQAEAAAAADLAAASARKARAAVEAEEVAEQAQRDLDFAQHVLRAAEDPEDDEFPANAAPWARDQIADAEVRQAEAAERLAAADAALQAAERQVEDAQVAVLCALGHDLPAAQAQAKAARFLRQHEAKLAAQAQRAAEAAAGGGAQGEQAAAAQAAAAAGGMEAGAADGAEAME